MSTEKWDKVKTVFFEALNLTGNERDEYVKISSKDAEILNEVYSLLSAYDESEQFMETPVVQGGHEGETQFFIGKYFGKYKLQKLIARGGMGLVFLGERNDEVKNSAAVKIINPGIVSGTVLKRFYTERQTLANLNHPGISKMLDAGVTGEGIQYLVMEYIKGEPIDDYCNNLSLSIRERLILFLKVVSAVSYAHQNLIVHRDLKPANILVTEEGEPKLLDFGIAKLLNDGYSGENTTQRGLFNLTPDYASPEQAAGSTITTSADIYSLGIVLYKLLTGLTPYTIKSYLTGDISSQIMKAEIKKPSELISLESIKEDKDNQEFFSSRENSSDKHRKTLQGDLDNIVLTALKKEPSRRYASAEQLAADIQRYLNNEPVTAHGDSLVYRGRKFIKRNKAAVTGVLLFFLLLLSGTAGILWQSRLTALERDNAKKEADKATRIKSFLSNMITAPDPRYDGADVKMIDVIKQAESTISTDLTGHAAVEAEIRTLIGTTYQNLAFYDSAESQMNKALNITRKVFGNKSAETAEALKNCGLVLHYKGEYDKAEVLYKQSINILKEINQTSTFTYAKALDIYGTLLTDAGDYEEAKKITLQALLTADKSRDKEDYNYGIIVNNLATAYNYTGDLNKADSLYRAALKIFTNKYGDNHIIISSVLNNLAFIHIYSNEHNKAIPLLEQSVNIKRKILGDGHPDLVLAYSNLGSTYFNDNQFDRAVKILKISVDIALKNFKEDNINVSRSYMWYGRALEAAGKPAEGCYYLRKAYLTRKKHLGEQNKLTLTTESQYGKCLLTAGKYAEAEKHLQNSYAGLKKALGMEDEAVKKTGEYLAVLYSQLGKQQKPGYYAKETVQK